jgi:hypothetical protein
MVAANKHTVREMNCSNASGGVVHSGNCSTVALRAAPTDTQYSAFLLLKKSKVKYFSKAYVVK